MPVEPSSSRRKFITGRFVTDAALDSAGDAVTPAQHQANRHEDAHQDSSCLLHLGRRAMACQFEVILNQQDRAQGSHVAVEAHDLVDQLESQLSVYRSDSELSALNRLARYESVSVESHLFDVLQLSLELCESTDGAFDITSTPLSKVWGFHRREGRMPAPADIVRALDDVGCQHVLLDASDRTVRFLHSHLEINLNGIGKGYALDRCSEWLAEHGVPSYLLHGGRSSVLAAGKRYYHGKVGDHWSIALRHPLRPDERVFEIDLCNEALATSGSATQSFYYQGRRYGHILDPRTGWPASGVLSATVLAPDAARADALSTAFYVIGAESAVQFCNARNDLKAIVIVPGSRAGSVEAHIIGLRDDQIRPCTRTPFSIVRH